MFSFNILQHRMIVMAGENNRRIFFGDKNLDLSGYRILLGGVPNIQDIHKSSAIEENVPEFIKQLTLLLHRERVNECTTIFHHYYFTFPALISS